MDLSRSTHTFFEAPVLEELARATACASKETELAAWYRTTKLDTRKYCDISRLLRAIGQLLVTHYPSANFKSSHNVYGVNTTILSSLMELKKQFDENFGPDDYDRVEELTAASLRDLTMAALASVDDKQAAHRLRTIALTGADS